MDKVVPFVAKISSVRTRTEGGKDYFTYRMNIPKEVADEISLAHGDYLFLKAMKARWYHMLNWKEMPRTWNMLPSELRSTIDEDLAPTIDEPTIQYSGSLTQYVSSGTRPQSQLVGQWRHMQ